MRRAAILAIFLASCTNDVRLNDARYIEHAPDLVTCANANEIHFNEEDANGNAIARRCVWWCATEPERESPHYLETWLYAAGGEALHRVYVCANGLE